MRSSEITAPEHADRLVLTPHAPSDVDEMPTYFGGTKPLYPRYWRKEGDAISYFSAANALGISPLQVREVEIGRWQFSQLTARRLLQKAIR